MMDLTTGAKTANSQLTKYVPYLRRLRAADDERLWTTRPRCQAIEEPVMEGIRIPPNSYDLMKVKAKGTFRSRPPILLAILLF